MTIGRRDLGVDVARGLALMSMFIAHVAPSDGPGNVLYLSEFLTVPLFATLIGIGLVLAWTRWSARSGRSYGRFLAGVAVRALALIGIGLALERLSLHYFVEVIIVLVQLGVLTMLAALLVRLRSTLIAALGILFAILGSVLPAVLNGPTDLMYSGYFQGRLGNLSPARALDVVAYGPYRVTHLLVWACLGILLARRFQLSNGLLGSQASDGRRDRTTWQVVRGDSLVAAAALVVAGGVFIARSTGVVTMIAYQRNVPEVAFDALLCIAVVCGSAVLVRLVPGRVLRPLALAGAMTLTLYVAQVLVLMAITAQHNAATWSDDSWAMLLGLIAGSLAFAALWHTVVRTGAFTRGPIEGVIDLAVRAVQKIGVAPAFDHAGVPADLGSPPERQRRPAGAARD